MTAVPGWDMPWSRQAVYLQYWHRAPFLFSPDLSYTMRTSQFCWLGHTYGFFCTTTTDRLKKFLHLQKYE